MQRYELVEGNSSKFWEVEITGADLTVRFGRLGTAGQSKTKTFADAQAAQKEWHKLVKEKTGKGYGLVGQGAGAPVALSSAPTPPPAVPALAVSERAAPMAAIVTSIPWPTGGFRWKDAWRDELPVVRGVHVPERVKPPQAASPLVPQFQVSRHGYEAQRLAALAAALGRSWTYWGRNPPVYITQAALHQPDEGLWLELMAQMHASNTLWQGHELRQVTENCIALHGLPFALRLALRLCPVIQNTPLRSCFGLLNPLREALACAGEVDYAATLATADELRGTQPWPQLICAHLFPHIAPWAEEAAMTAPAADAMELLKDCTLSVPTFLKLQRKEKIWIGSLRPALLLQARLHGDAAFDVFALALAQSLGDKTSTLEALALALAMRLPQLVPLLVGAMDNKEVRAALDKLSQEFPAAVLACAIARALQQRERAIESWCVRLALRESDALAVALGSLDASQRSRFEAVLAQLHCEEAPVEQLPKLLREPPWLQKVRQQEPPVLDIGARSTKERLEWTEQEISRARDYAPPGYALNSHSADGFAQQLYLKPQAEQRLLQGGPLQADDFLNDIVVIPPCAVAAAPVAAQLALWNGIPASRWHTGYDKDAPIRALIARHGLAALPGFMTFLEVHPDKGLPLCAGIDSPRLVEPMLRALRNLKKLRSVAEIWISAHVRTVLVQALPAAFRAGAAAARDDARHAIRWLVARGNEPLAREIAQGYATGMPEALDALLAQDPLQVTSGKVPRLPTFVVPAALCRPQLATGGALPTTAIEYLATMLALSKLDAPYPGLEIVKSACTPASLAEFAWDLFEAWMAAGAPSKEGWAFTALGLLGDDETARRLAPRIRQWPGEAAHARAVTGLDLLAAIGSDVALMHLNGIAGKVKFKALQQRASEKIAVVAQARGFTPEELADRLVPDLGLDDSGTIELDFGPRRLTLGFDEALKPFVRDAQGVRLKDLPKPLKSDDAALAGAATDRYKQMKKDAKAVASLQLVRLEMAMMTRRRWPARNFRLFFLAHPLMRHLAARLVWGVYENARLVRNLRVAEDWTLADENDERCELADGAIVGISHVLEMPRETLEAFGQVFADYEIVQPFAQLGRETYSLNAQEQQQHTLTRFADKVVATGSILGLVNRGWERGQAQDGGWVGEFSKMVGYDLQVDVQLDPGTCVDEMSYEPKQRMPQLTLRRRGSYDASGLVPCSLLDPIVCSEVLRDLELLAPVKE